MFVLLSNAPDPLPLSLTPAEKIQTMPGDVMMAWTDMVPNDGTLVLSISALWIGLLVIYSFVKFFKQPTGMMPGNES